MPTFAYTARDMTGKQVTGTIEATGEREVTAILSERSLFPVNVKDLAFGRCVDLWASQEGQRPDDGDLLYAAGLAASRRRADDSLAQRAVRAIVRRGAEGSCH